MTDKPLTEQEVRGMREGLESAETTEQVYAFFDTLTQDWLRLQKRLAEAERERDELSHTLNEQNRPLEKGNA